MNKLVELLKQIGGSDELVKQISEEVDRFLKSVYEDYDAKFNEKLLKAKQICSEELDKEKAALARKVAVYLESKSETMQNAHNRQKAIEEAEAKSLLKRAKALLEGIQLDDDGNSRNLQAIEKKAERLEKALNALKEDRDAWTSKASKANEIATKSLQHASMLESTVKDLRKQLNESKTQVQTAQPKSSTPAKPVIESKTQPKEQVIVRSARLDESRIIPNKSVVKRPLTELNSAKKKVTEIDDIANQLEL